MSVVVGLEAPGHGAWLAAESQMTNRDDVHTMRTTPKVWRDGIYVIGFVGSGSEGDMLRYRVDWPLPSDHGVDVHDHDAMYQFMATRFVDTIHQAQAGRPWERTSERGEKWGPTLLVAVADQVYSVFSDYQVLRTTCGYHAIGSGDALALGALHALTTYNTGQITPATIVARAVEAAKVHHGDCGGPTVVVATGVDQ